MNRHVFRIALAALGFLPAIASADPLLSFGPNVPFFITAAAAVRREDNVFLSSRDRQADTIFVLVPGTDIHWTGGKASLGIAFSEQFSRYSTNRELDDHLANLASSFAYNGANSSLKAAASYQQEDQTSLTLQSSDQTVRHSLADASLNAEVALAAKTRLGLGASFDRTTYPEVGFIDSDVWALPVDLYFATTPKTDLSLGYRHDIERLDTGRGNFQDNFFNIGARGDFTAKLSGQIRVGVTDYKPEAGAGSRDLGFGASLDYLFTPKTAFDLTANKGFSASPLGTGEKVLSIGLSGRSQLSQAWLVTLGGNYESTDYLINPERRDSFWVGNLAVNYTWTSAVGFQLDYVYRKNNSTLALATFDDNVLIFTASTRF